MPYYSEPNEQVSKGSQDEGTATQPPKWMNAINPQARTDDPQPGVQYENAPYGPTIPSEVQNEGLPLKASEMDPLRPIKAPKVDKVKMNVLKTENTRPKCLIPLYPSFKWGIPNPKIHQYWREKDIKAKEKRLLNMAVPKSGGPWSGKKNMEGAMAHQEDTGIIKPVKKGKGKGKGPPKSHQLKIIKVIQKPEKKRDEHPQPSKKHITLKEGWKAQVNKGVQTPEMYRDLSSDLGAIQPPFSTMEQDKPDQGEWETGETEWEMVGEESQPEMELGPWTEEEAWYQQAAFAGDGENLEGTEGEE